MTRYVERIIKSWYLRSIPMYYISCMTRRARVSTDIIASKSNVRITDQIEEIKAKFSSSSHSPVIV